MAYIGLVSTIGFTPRQQVLQAHEDDVGGVWLCVVTMWFCGSSFLAVEVVNELTGAGCIRGLIECTVTVIPKPLTHSLVAVLQFICYTLR